MARERQIALLFPGQGSQTADMRETVERSRPDLLELAFEAVGPDLFERAADGTRWAPSARVRATARRSPRWPPPATWRSRTTTPPTSSCSRAPSRLSTALRPT